METAVPSNSLAPNTEATPAAPVSAIVTGNGETASSAVPNLNDSAIAKAKTEENLGDATVSAGDLMANISQDSSKIEIKLFVGRVPRNYEEEQLRPEFEQFGQVLEVAILKDKISQTHKGSAFVRMASISNADAAIRALNNVKALDPSLGAMQVRYATGEAEKFGFSIDNGQPGQDQVKLFVGSLPRNVTEEQVTEIFSRFGKIDEVFLLKDTTTGLNKGCAFVKFAFKENAIRAIRSLNGNMTIPGGPRAIEVRVAESKKMPQPGMAGGMGFTGGMMGGASRPSIPGMNSTSPMPGMGGMAGMTGMGAMGMQMQAASQSLSGGQQGPSAATAAAAAAAASNANPRQGGMWREYFTPDGRAYYHNTLTNLTQWEKPEEFNTQRSGGDATGPPGANIFVFHIPNDWGQADLIQNFSHFGTILSARIATDKVTNRNRGYAFVSYDNIQSSVQAVLHMNGFMACGKRLKVSIKQNEDKYVAHILPQATLMSSGPTGGNMQQQQMQQQQLTNMSMPASNVIPGANMFNATAGQPQMSSAPSIAMLSQNQMLAQQSQLPTQPGQMTQAAAFNAFSSFPTGTAGASQRYAPY